MFEKSHLVHQVFQMFGLIVNCSHEILQQKYDFKEIKQLTLLKLDDKVMKKLNGYLMSNKQLSVDNIMRINRPLGVMYSLI